MLEVSIRVISVMTTSTSHTGGIHKQRICHLQSKQQVLQATKWFSITFI